MDPRPTTPRTDALLPTAIQDLVALRVSQVNGHIPNPDPNLAPAPDPGAGCGRAAATGERLRWVARWRQATVFTEAERAALELAEQGARIAGATGTVSDQVWARAAEHYDREQLTALVLQVSFLTSCLS